MKKQDINSLPFKFKVDHWYGEYTDEEIAQLQELLGRKVKSISDGNDGVIFKVGEETGKPLILWSGLVIPIVSDWFAFTLIEPPILLHK